MIQYKGIDGDPNIKSNYSREEIRETIFEILEWILWILTVDKSQNVKYL